MEHSRLGGGGTVKYKDEMENSRTKTPRHQDETDWQPALPATLGN